MKKKSAVAKLRLQTETIHALQPAELTVAVGGLASGLCSQACTHGCPPKTPNCPI